MGNRASVGTDAVIQLNLFADRQAWQDSHILPPLTPFNNDSAPQMPLSCFTNANPIQPLYTYSQAERKLVG